MSELYINKATAEYLIRCELCRKENDNNMSLLSRVNEARRTMDSLRRGEIDGYPLYNGDKIGYRCGAPNPWHIITNGFFWRKKNVAAQ